MFVCYPPSGGGSNGDGHGMENEHEYLAESFEEESGGFEIVATEKRTVGSCETRLIAMRT